MSSFLKFLFITILAVVSIFILMWVDKKFLMPKRVKSDQDKIKAAQEREEELANYRKAEQDYYSSLNDLKNSPNNSDIKQEVLAKGRYFSSLTRQFQGINGVTVVDEVSIMNDINAACAGATLFPQNTKSHSIIEERLAKLSELKEKNLISEDEYNQRRQKILDEI